jgi:hypothetical protein
VIDSNSLERDAGGKPLSTFSDPARLTLQPQLMQSYSRSLLGFYTENKAALISP